MISGFHRDVDEICALLGCYAACSGQFLTDVSGQPVGPIFKGQEDGTDRVSRNVCKDLPLHAA